MAVRRLCSTHARSMPLQPGQHMNRTIACTDRSTQLHANRTELRPISRRECSSPYRVPYESILSAIICCYFYFPIIVTASHYQSSKLQYMRALNSYSDRPIIMAAPATTPDHQRRTSGAERPIDVQAFVTHLLTKADRLRRRRSSHTALTSFMMIAMAPW